MEPIKNQHYVAQSYLKNFSLNEQVFVFNKFNSHVFKSHVRNVASERFFYDFPQDSNQTMEHLYSALEDRQARLLRHIQKK